MSTSSETAIVMSTSEATPGSARASRPPASRVLAASIHFAASVLIGLLAFALVFFVWYPGPFWQMSGGQALFFIVVSVDVVIGPLITLIIFNPAKPRSELALDLAVIALIQAAALTYGMWSIAQARPVFAVFNVDRVSVIRAIDLHAADYALAERPEFSSAPLWGPMLVATRHAKTDDERVAMISSALSGRDVVLQPKYYVPYAEAHDELIAHAHPLVHLYVKNPDNREGVKAAIASLGRDPEGLRYVPTIAREDWVAIIDATSGALVTYLPLHGF